MPVRCGMRRVWWNGRKKMRDYIERNAVLKLIDAMGVTIDANEIRKRVRELPAADAIPTGANAGTALHGFDFKRQFILSQAEHCVCGKREQDYGSPEDNFGRIAAMWEAYMRGNCVSDGADICIAPKDVAAMMALLKIARIASGNAKTDNWVDLAGYAACGGELEGIGDD